MVIRRYYKYLLAIVILVFLVINFRRLLVEPAQHTLIINEFAASNGGSLTDEDGDKSDWIELYNCNPFPVNLANWSLTDDPDQPDKWIFPDIVLPAGEYLVIFASGKDRVNHTNFKLNAQGGYLGLFQPTSRRYLDLSTIVYPPQSAGISYGRLNEHSAYFDIPTPGRANNEASAWLGLTPPVEFGVSRGFFEQPFTVTLAAATPDTVIYYTANGSEPTPRTGQRYANPISITRTTLLRAMAVQPKRKPSASVTHSYIFIADVLKQPQTPPGFPATWGTHAQDMVVKANDTLYAAGTPAIADYEMDPDIVDDPEYHDLLVEGLQTIPSLSIVTDLDAFTDLYSNPRERGVEWERPVSAEWIDPDGDDFQINAGLRIQGGTGRFEYVPKHSFRLFFRGEYGAPQLDFPLFPDSPVTQFNTLILRGGANRSYAGNKDARPRKTAYTRDEWLRRSQIEMSGSGSRGTFVHLYLNGLYWGLYNVVERPDAAFAASYFGGDKKNWHAHNHDGPISGDSTRVYALGEFMLENEHGGFGDPQNYALLQEYLDVEAFADYVILNWYAGNQDWDTSNWYALVKNPAGKVRFFVWDAEHTWTKGALLYLELYVPSNLIGRLLMALFHNPEFKMTFADQVYKHLFNGGVLTEENAIRRWQQINQPLDPAIIGESARWGDARYEKPVNYERWQKEQRNVIEQMTGNVDKMIGLLREDGYYPPFDPPAFSRRGGIVSPGCPLTMTAPQGEIYYTTNGSDPREAYTGGIAPNAILYVAPPVITQTTPIKARTRLRGGWSALAEATFFIDQPIAYLATTEIMYNPLGGDDYEFIELHNFGNDMIDLSNMTFEGVNYTFPSGAKLAAGETLVLVRNAVAFRERYPGVEIGGVYGGKLSNKGEKIILRAANGSALLTIAYDDENGWPLSADGRGDSLVVIDPLADLNIPQNWRAGKVVNGSPGWAVE